MGREIKSLLYTSGVIASAIVLTSLVPRYDRLHAEAEQGTKEEVVLAGVPSWDSLTAPVSRFIALRNFAKK